MRNHRWTGILVIATVVMTATPALAGTRLFFRGPLTDLQTTDDPTDGAIAGARVLVDGGTTTVELVVRGIDKSWAGETFGAHVHVGPCVAGDGAAALGHYNAGGAASPETEVWLDFTVTRAGTGHSKARVPFEIIAGAAGSVVIHALATGPDGAAGARLACLPLAF